MKRFALMTLMFCLILCACAKTPQETTKPPFASDLPTFLPTETTEHIDPAPDETTVPEESTIPEETSAPVETKPGNSYTVRITDPEKGIYAGPAFRYPMNAILGETGTYTIVEESTDWDGNLWGKLKSGAGWICLTDPEMIPIWADFAPDHFVSFDSWHCGETEYVTHIGILPNEHITDIQFTQLSIGDVLEPETLLYHIEEAEADGAMKFSVVFWGDMTTYGFSFNDSNGNRRHFALSISGKDGSLVYSEYMP